MPVSKICSLPKHTLVLTTFWTVLFFLALGIRVFVGYLGEAICTGILVAGTTVAFTCWKEPRIFLQTAASGGIIASGDSSIGEHCDEITELEQSSNSRDAAENDTITDIASNESITTGTSIHADETDATTPATGAARETVATAARRMPFLDNVKIFLTALVVTHHVACAFGGCGEGTWYLIVGFGGPPAFQHFVKGLTLADQSYFMPLFFFISAYFIPSSYERAGGKWHNFAQNKRKRLLIPALFEFFVISPLAIILSGNLVYAPNPGVAWFLFWLLLFLIIYAPFLSVKGYQRSSATQNNNLKALIAIPNDPLQYVGTTDEEATDASPVGATIFTSTWLRMVCGVSICGVALLPFVALQLGTFASMPIFSGSLTCDFFMFYLGLKANTNRWFERPLVEQLDIHPLVLALMVVFEYVAMMALSSEINIEVWWPLLLIIAGMFCLDMSLLVLLVFQQWFNFETRLTRFFARGAYGVYLTHPLIVVGTTLLYVRICDYYYYYYYYYGNGESDASSYEYYYPLGFVFVNVVSHLINWPLAYFLTQLPCLKTIL